MTNNIIEGVRHFRLRSVITETDMTLIDRNIYQVNTFHNDIRVNHLMSLLDEDKLRFQNSSVQRLAREIDDNSIKVTPLVVSKFEHYLVKLKNTYDSLIENDTKQESSLNAQLFHELLDALDNVAYVVKDEKKTISYDTESFEVLKLIVSHVSEYQDRINNGVYNIHTKEKTPVLNEIVSTGLMSMLEGNSVGICTATQRAPRLLSAVYGYLVSNDFEGNNFFRDATCGRKNIQLYMYQPNIDGFNFNEVLRTSGIHFNPKWEIFGMKPEDRKVLDQKARVLTYVLKKEF